MTLFKEKQVIVELIPDPEIGGFTAYIPDIPAYGEGKTKEEAISDLKEAIVLLIEEIGPKKTAEYIRTPVTVDRQIMSVSDFSLA